jgi:hypothetical protein
VRERPARSGNHVSRSAGRSGLPVLVGGAPATRAGQLEEDLRDVGVDGLSRQEELLADGTVGATIVDPQFFPEDFAQDLNPKLAAEIAAQQRPSSLALFATPSASAAWHALPSWYAVSAHDRAVDPALQRLMAQRAGSTTVQFSAASHVGGLTHYRARFTKLIEQASDATAS